ncbi:MAG TPA: hemolysin family protein [Candidatus Nanopelagicales bacterium]|nr:hemolysin family protein [Candidatus Nanopelagicales bacterium]
MDSLDVLLLVMAAALVPIAGLLAAADAAITMVSPARLEELARDDRRGASSLLTITEDRPRYTNLLLLLRITAEITATVMVAKVALTTLGFQFWVGVLLVAVMVVVTYVVIGVLPRTIGRQHPYLVGLALAPPTRALARLLAPVASLLILIGNAITPGRGFREGPFSSDIELRELVDIAGSRGVVEETEREMLQSVFDLGDTIVREVMVPRTEMVWIERDKSLRQALALASRSGMSRIPVIGDDVDDVVGIAYLKDLVARAMTLEPGDKGPVLTEVMREPVFVPESKNVDDLLREMQRDRTHFAVVVDEYGGTAGIVTIEDILEEIVGEITDEYDADTPAPVERLADGSFRVSARLPVEDLGELFDVELDDGEVDTVGGLLAQQLGRVPLPGAEASVAGLFLHGDPGVDRRGRPRVQTVLVRRLTRAELAAEEAEREREARDREDQRRAEEAEEPEPAAAAEWADPEPAPAEQSKPRKKKKKKPKPPAEPATAPTEPGSSNGSTDAANLQAGSESANEPTERDRAG